VGSINPIQPTLRSLNRGELSRWSKFEIII
jgi:hypothetical protein